MNEFMFMGFMKNKKDSRQSRVNALIKDAKINGWITEFDLRNLLNKHGFTKYDLTAAEIKMLHENNRYKV